MNGTFVLNDANVQINNTPATSYNSSSWNTVRDYQFSYDTYSAATSSDGVNWTTITGSSRAMSNLSGTVQLGLAVTSHNTGALSAALFDQLSASIPAPGSITVTPIAAADGTSSYPIQTAYNDASQPTTLTYSDNEVASYGYDANSGWLSSLSTTPAGGSATTLLGNIGYSGAGGAAGHATSASVGGGAYTFSSSYDADTRLSSLSVSNTSASAVLFQSQRGYDALGNVTAVATTLSAGTDNQAFCYEEQNRLVWAGSIGTPSCGSSLTPGSLSSANYTQTFAYDNLARLTSGPLGSYTYGDSAHLHAVTSIGSDSPTYTAKYDAVGDMSCRAPDNTTPNPRRCRSSGARPLVSLALGTRTHRHRWSLIRFPLLLLPIVLPMLVGVVCGIYVLNGLCIRLLFRVVLRARVRCLANDQYRCISLTGIDGKAYYGAWVRRFSCSIGRALLWI